MDILDLTDGECHCGQLRFLYRDFFFFFCDGVKEDGERQFNSGSGKQRGCAWGSESKRTGLYSS